jgi:beta-glucuronidase
MIDLSGFWDFQFDPDNTGQQAAQFSRPIAVPASWNDQFEDGRDYLGSAWYQTRFDLPWGWESQRVYLRFGSVNYLAEVWLNGDRLGQHEGGHLPFEFEVTNCLQPEGNLLVVRVEGELRPDRVPPGSIPRDPKNVFPNQNYPDASFDFFPFCGIQRPVLLYTTPQQAIEDITVVTDIVGKEGRVAVQVDCEGAGTIRCTLTGHDAEISADADLHGGTTEVVISVPDAALWSPSAPNLYDLTVQLFDGSTELDRCALAVGIRTIAVQGDLLLLNGEPIKLVGFGRHEDFPVAGRGFLPPVIVKDYALMKWIGANSFRTTHYPYSEAMLNLADRLGFMVIAETPAVGLFFSEEGLQRRLELCRQYTQELIGRDKNHPSVIMWSLANEPHTANRPEAKPFFRDLYDLAKSLDSTRPTTIVSMVGVGEESFEFCDVATLNRYHGWYSDPGQPEVGQARLAAELDAIHAKYPKPLLLTEFGADALSGWHAQPIELFSEEYQARLITDALDAADARLFVAGTHVWNLCDFKTAQAIHRVGGINHKGVFTRDRRPKLAAHVLRDRWTKSNQ